MAFFFVVAFAPPGRERTFLGSLRFRVICFGRAQEISTPQTKGGPGAPVQTTGGKKWSKAKEGAGSGAKKGRSKVPSSLVLFLLAHLEIVALNANRIRQEDNRVSLGSLIEDTGAGVFVPRETHPAMAEPRRLASTLFAVANGGSLVPGQARTRGGVVTIVGQDVVFERLTVDEYGSCEAAPPLNSRPAPPLLQDWDVRVIRPPRDAVSRGHALRLTPPAAILRRQEVAVGQLLTGDFYHIRWDRMVNDRMKQQGIHLLSDPAQAAHHRGNALEKLLLFTGRRYPRVGEKGGKRRRVGRGGGWKPLLSGDYLAYDTGG